MPQEAKRQSTDSMNKQDAYLRHPGSHVMVVVVLAVLLAAGGLTWFFFGCNTVFRTGAFESSNMTANCLIPADEASQISPGDTVWIGNTRGTITSIDTENPFTKDFIVDLFAGMANTGLEDNVSYYQFIVEFDEELPTYGTYRIPMTTMSPFESLLARLS